MFQWVTPTAEHYGRKCTILSKNPDRLCYSLTNTKFKDIGYEIRLEMTDIDTLHYSDVSKSWFNNI